MVGLNHAVLFVTDAEQSAAFYSEILGLEVVMREPRAGAVFLRAPGSDNHHDLGLFGLGAAARRPGRGAVGLYHVAWQVPTIDELSEVRERMARTGALTGESSHGATKSLYGADPDGIEFEVMWLLPRGAWGDYEHAAVVEPLDLAAEIKRWSGVAT